MLTDIVMSRALAPVRQAFPRSWRQRLHKMLTGDPLERLVTAHGSFQSIKATSSPDLLRAATYFQHREKIDVAMSAATSWYGGDYLEFGACDLFTFRNFLSAFHMTGLIDRFPDTCFYAFDVFGKLTSDDESVASDMQAFDKRTSYFSAQFPNGDDLTRHQALLRDHNLFLDRCELVQGFFSDTLTRARADQYKADGRSIGFAFIDCNFEEFYKQVFEFIFGMMAQNSYIYMDEYFQSSGAAHYFDAFAARLRTERKIECMYVRSAGGFGGLFRLRPVRDLPALQPLN